MAHCIHAWSHTSATDSCAAPATGLMPINIPQSELKAAIAEDKADSAAMHYPFLATISRDAASCLTSPQATTQDSVDSVMKVMLPVKLSFGDADGVAAVSLMKAQVCCFCQLCDGTGVLLLCCEVA